MSDQKTQIEEKIKELEAQMLSQDFWSDKNKAQAILKELAELKMERGGVNKYDKGNAIMTIIAGAGGDDSEDFVRMLIFMYKKYAEKKKWDTFLIHEHKNDHGGYRNISIEIIGENVYGTLKNESGVHRLVRMSPFNAKQLRHTSFVLVEVLPKFSKLEEKDIVIPENDLKIEFSRSSGPGGQNVNKRETAVRVVHVPTNLSAHASGERSQEQNRERALSILKAKIFKKAQDERKDIQESMKLTKNLEIEWGNQIRSYVLHPYKMIKNHNSGFETSDVKSVLEDGNLDDLIKNM